MDVLATLLYWCRDQESEEPIVYCDPLNNPSTVNLKALGDLGIRHISEVAPDHFLIINNDRHHVLHIPMQPNETICGFYVMLTIRMMVEEFIQGYGSTDFVSMAQALV